jgi:transcriptional regulator GlxA family with amidase domain
MLGSVDERCWLKNLAISQLYMMLCEELERHGNTKSTFHILVALLVQLQREINAGNAMVGWPFASNTAPQPGARLLGRAMKYINDHLEEHLTIDIVAHQVGVSRSVLTREFRENAKSTFTHYLIAQRMKRAETLLTEANIPVNRVSRDVGFSPERLRVLFREKHQCSPDEFRKVKK